MGYPSLTMHRGSLTYADIGDMGSSSETMAPCMHTPQLPAGQHKSVQALLSGMLQHHGVHCHVLTTYGWEEQLL